RLWGRWGGPPPPRPARPAPPPAGSEAAGRLADPRRSPALLPPYILELCSQDEPGFRALGAAHVRPVDALGGWLLIGLPGEPLMRRGPHRRNELEVRLGEQPLVEGADVRQRPARQPARDPLVECAGTVLAQGDRHAKGSVPRRSAPRSGPDRWAMVRVAVLRAAIRT